MESNELTGTPAQVAMVVEITRAGTGAKETYELTGTIVPVAGEKIERDAQHFLP